jgi:uncharacterized protein YciI
MASPGPLSDPSPTMSWNELLERSRSLDLPAMQLFVVSSKPTNGLGPVLAALDRHLPYQKELEDKGIMFAAGPLVSEDGERWDGEGHFIYHASSFEEATALAEGDPMHQLGARTFTVRAWCLNEGTTVTSAAS